MYDIIFISYREPNAEENWERLISRFPMAKRVNGVTGIHQAHIAGAKKSFTKMTWFVDGDAKILDDFDFSYRPTKWEENCVHVWRSQNPINDLVYGYGGIKLFPTRLTKMMDTSKPDMTTSITTNFKPVNVVSNITAFNTDPFNTWKSAFRECCKLSSKIIDRQVDEETANRLEIWKTVGEDRPFGKYALDGATQGADYGEKHVGDIDSLKRINDFDWLEEQFNARNL